MDGSSTTSLWIETPDQREGPVARVAMALAVDKEYSYAIPDELVAQVEPGKRLIVPFGRKDNPQQAICLAVGRAPWTNTLRPVSQVLDDQRLISDQLLELGQWIARYYVCPPGKALAAMVPEAIKRQRGFRTVRYYRLADRLASWQPDQPLPDGMTSPNRKRVLHILRDSDGELDRDSLIQRAEVSAQVIVAMVKSGLLCERRQKEPEPAPDFDRPGTEPVFELNDYQTSAIDRIVRLADQPTFRALLVHGVSGSGKTEIYIHAIRDQLRKNRQAILLVPEIALTTQIVDRLACRFRDVAVIHSGLTGVQRSLTWSAIARGEKKVVIGTRSAVFAPCPNLGLIVVDEEQDTSYKNQQAPRYHTRDVAIKRAQMTNIPIVLGSATPSLETWWNCTQFRHFEKLPLPERVGGLPLPPVKVVDMRDEQKQRRGIHLLSIEMEHGLRRTLEAGRQAVLFLNRRGYASYLVCAQCRVPIVCPNCQAYMVFHQTSGKAVCHYCHANMIVPTKCGNPSCGGELIRFGMGTQRVEEELRQKFPAARVARADSDTMKRPEDYGQLVQNLETRAIDVLVGTQMIAKGLDFPQVSFVGVINADTSMALPDFRAGERTFQLITQVAGRAGRADATGSVVVQSLSGMSAALRFAMKHDFKGFAEHELGVRRQFRWPPFSRLARVIVAHARQSVARETAVGLVDQIRDRLRFRALTAEVLGPQVAPLLRLKNRYRYDFQIRAPRAAGLMQVLDDLRQEQILTPKTKDTLIDVDPLSLL